MTPRRTWVTGLLLSLGFGAALTPAVVTMRDRGVDIVAYELARTTAEAERLNALLGEAGREAARLSTWLDFGFLTGYGLLIAGLALAAAQRLPGSWVAAWAPRVAVGAAVAAGCDAVEDVALLVVAGGTTDQPWPAIAFGFASVKFVLLAACVSFLVTAVVGSRGLRRR